MTASRKLYYRLLLIPFGILVNFGLSQLCKLCGIPLFFDSLGTILTAALGGYLPGMIAGFASNAIISIGDPISLYYGILNVLIAIATTFLTQRGFLRNPLRALVPVLTFSFIGGIIGSGMTWLLYGFGFGSGISAPFAIALHNAGLPEFWAQFAADVAIDFVDKLLMVMSSLLVLRLFSDKLLDAFPLGHIHIATKKQRPFDKHAIGAKYRKYSLRTKIALLFVISSVILGALSISISVVIFKSSITERYADIADGVTTLLKCELDGYGGDKITQYIVTGEPDTEYDAIKSKLEVIKDSFSDIKYIYVYQIRENDCMAVFDLDSTDADGNLLEGNALGVAVPFDEDFGKHLDKLRAGEEIPPVESHGQYGWLLSMYKPIVDSDGNCVAYIAADIEMSTIRIEEYVYIIKLLSLLFGAASVIIMLVLFFLESRIIKPINKMTEIATEFANDNAESRLLMAENMKATPVRTGDEIELLYSALSKTASDVAVYITDLKQNAEYITKLQDGIITSFADMVESRDENTGDHIHHTARYVECVAKGLRKNGKYTDLLTDAYIADLTRSAPLHDIGKIRISDTILNKPGKLTHDEFELMKTHTTAGREILHNAVANLVDKGYLAVAMDMAQSHHEKWDGSGYPDALAGNDIPLPARIMAVADVYDALISKRSYKEAMPPEKAKEIIISESGAHFDPDIVEAFLTAYDEIVKTTR